MNIMAFIFVLAVAIAVFAVVHLAGFRPTFYQVFEKTGLAIIFVPILLVFWSAATVVVLLCGIWILNEFGLLTSVSSWSIWRDAPHWAWLALAVVVVATLGNLAMILPDVFRKRPTDIDRKSHGL